MTKKKITVDEHFLADDGEFDPTGWTLVGNYDALDLSTPMHLASDMVDKVNAGCTELKMYIEENDGIWVLYAR